MYNTCVCTYTRFRYIGATPFVTSTYTARPRIGWHTMPCMLVMVLATVNFWTTVVAAEGLSHADEEAMTARYSTTANTTSQEECHVDPSHPVIHIFFRRQTRHYCLGKTSTCGQVGNGVTASCRQALKVRCIL